ncbi:MAG: hypothetical protein ACOYKR_13385, partial [Sphingobacterium thalpophilum]
HIKNPIFNGIQFESSTNSQIINCVISEGVKNNGMLRGLFLKGLCNGTLVKDNSISSGKIAGIKNDARGVFLKKNVSLN